MSISARLGTAISHPHRDIFRGEIGRLERHSAIADQTAMATELLRASRFREGNAPFGHTDVLDTSPT